VEVPLRLNEGVTVVEANPRHAVGRAFEELAAKLRRVSASGKAPVAAKRSFFKRG